MTKKQHRVVWTIKALEQLDAIKRFIARDSPANALRFVRRLYRHARRLKTLPLSGAAVPEFGDPETREIICGNYRIIYEIVMSTVRILAVRHGARRLGRGDLAESQRNDES